MTTKFSTDLDSLVYFGEEANSAFWDAHWHSSPQTSLSLDDARADSIFCPALQRYISPGSRVLEGGCGRGRLVKALHDLGYQTTGIDVAADTIARLKADNPQLDFAEGDVFQIKYPDSTFDAYISVGVIEHFLGGYSGILSEAARILKPGGFIFVSFPHINILRRLRIYLNKYESIRSSEIESESFYQFAFSSQQVRAALMRQGFEIVTSKSYDGLKGLKDDTVWLRPMLQRLYDYNGKWRSLVFIRRLLSFGLRGATGHMQMIVAKKL